jgi:hypothetical protein
MGRLDELKEDLGYLKIVFGILVTLDASLIAWMASNYKTADFDLFFSGMFLALVTTVSIALAHLRIKKNIKEVGTL